MLNLRPNFGAIEPEVRVVEGDVLSYEFTVADPDPQDSITVTATGLPPGVTLVQINATTWELQGDPGPAAADYPIVLTATDNGSPNLSTTATLDIIVDYYRRSELAGQLVVTEVLYAQSGAFDEFIELRNIGSDPVSLSWLRVLDANLRADGPDSDSAGGPVASQPESDLAATLGTQDLDGNPSILDPGERAVLWVRYDLAIDFPGRTPAELHYSLRTRSLQLPALDNEGDDVWIFESGEEALIAYVAWGDAGSGELGTPPHASLDVWDPSAQDQLNSLADGESIALATDGPGSKFSACWEENGTGEASQGGCPETTSITVDRDSSPANRDSSAGLPNI